MADAVIHPELSNAAQTSAERHGGDAGSIHDKADEAGMTRAVEAGFKPLSHDAINLLLADVRGALGPDLNVFLVTDQH
ncbi:hypothetical protein BB934_01965 [Microvirga ossetica]|uniref:Uncharacterized protein n=1 Tax=Microvirga ossetica TaxID=1882682 RepID=A0A1B2EAX6_9HYPH|nr:hypothetical protein [Microvirga ossetica]ANY77136.1 hypothetical protein BB934_01965 [Microvirga ossetica]